MKKEEAISSFQKEIDYLKTYPLGIPSTKHTTIREKIRIAFGEESHYNTKINDINFSALNIIQGDPPEYTPEQSIIAKNTISLLEECREYIKDHGVNKKPKPNILTEVSNYVIVSAIVGSFIFQGSVFWLGFSVAKDLYTTSPKYKPTQNTIESVNKCEKKNINKNRVHNII